MERPYQICTRCVMDTTDPDIVFDETGCCNHCTKALESLARTVFLDPAEKKQKLEKIIVGAKAKKKHQKYDCLIGLSGGLDSSYLAYYVVKKLNLTPLAVHVDNGWNTELAVMNIHNIVNVLGIDLITHVINWQEFKALQKAFLRASVIDLELLSDHAIGVVNASIAKKHKIITYFNGHNISTESIMPSSWLFSSKRDSLNIKDIYKKQGSGLKLYTYPFLNFYGFLRYGKDINRVTLLNYIEYNKIDAQIVLSKELGWRDYGGKHYESRITKFYQNYILPRKYNVDKRKAHLSSLICSNQISREEALKKLSEPLWVQEEIEGDIDYFIKKLELSNEEFRRIMGEPPRSHYEYKSYTALKKNIGVLVKKFGYRGNSKTGIGEL